MAAEHLLSPTSHPNTQQIITRTPGPIQGQGKSESTWEGTPRGMRGGCTEAWLKSAEWGLDTSGKGRRPPPSSQLAPRCKALNEARESPRLSTGCCRPRGRGLSLHRMGAAGGPHRMLGIKQGTHTLV